MKNKKILITIVLIAILAIMVVILMLPLNKKSNSIETKTENLGLDIESSNEEINTNWKDGTYTDITLTESMSITKAGTYRLTGTLEDGNISVNVGNEELVTLVLDNVNITSSEGPAIYVENADKVIIVLEEGTTNTLTDGTTYADEEIDGCIYSKDDLVITGKGNLNVVANYLDGIVGKDDLKIIEANINVTANDDGIRGKDSLEIKDATIKVVSKGDGIKTTNDTEEDKGYIIIENGNIIIESQVDGIQAETNLKIDGGSYEVTAGDDGIHANGMLQIDDGTFNITAAEGLEATYVKINGGTINIQASDDGINGANKSDSYSVTVEINNGNLTIKMGSGDTDAIDSNGNIYINGGTIDITGNSPFDYDGKAEYNGGTIIVNGTQTNTITNQMMGGEMQNGGMPGSNGMEQRRIH